MTEQNSTNCLANKCNSFQRLPIVANLLYGLKVWSGELRWMLTDAGRCWEVRQLEKRLAQESASLGEFTQASIKDSKGKSCPITEEMQRASGQIGFLQDEIIRLTDEHNALAEQRACNKRNA